jgi:hypothetical protein
MKKQTIFLTGATGHMGLEGLKQLVKHLDVYNLTLLVLPTEHDKEVIAPYEKNGRCKRSLRRSHRL